MIINELVSNSLKYAFPLTKGGEKKKAKKGEITIRLSSENGKIVLLYKDNGVGLPEDFNIEIADSFGLQLVTALVAQLNGTIEIKRKPGAAFKITFNQSDK